MDSTSNDAIDEAEPGRGTWLAADELETRRVLAALHGDGDERDDQGAWPRWHVRVQQDRPSDVGATR
jgi:hypothetical protein